MKAYHEISEQFHLAKASGFSNAGILELLHIRFGGLDIWQMLFIEGLFFTFRK